MDSISPLEMYILFCLGATVFSMSLLLWFFLDNSKHERQPNKTLSLAIVIVALVLESCAGVRVEEFCLIALPVTVGVVVVLSSAIVVGPAKSNLTLEGGEKTNRRTLLGCRRRDGRGEVGDHSEAEE